MNHLSRPRASAVRLAAAAASVALALSGCAAVPAPVVPSPTPASIDGTPQPTPTAPTASTPSPVAPATPDAAAKPYALETLTEAQRAEVADCLGKTIGAGSTGPCAQWVQTKLAASGMLTDPLANRINVAGMNALLNYQRSRGIKAADRVTEQTWVALASGAPLIPEVMPAECKAAGVVLCVDQAHRKLTYVKDGVPGKSVPVRLGGWTYHPKTKKWRIFGTANGTWKVYNKNVDPPSENYGYGVMPYSVIFYPDMYVHYSANFEKRGYSQSSHGCVNVGNLDDAKWFYANTPIGATVYIF